MDADVQVREVVAMAVTSRSSGTQREVDVTLTARLSDGQEVPLLTGRGFSSWMTGGELPDPGDADLEDCAWVVGPDEAFGSHTPEDMAKHHWASIADTLRAHGVAADPASLMRAPFRVVWGSQTRVWPQGFPWS